MCVCVCVCVKSDGICIYILVKSRRLSENHFNQNALFFRAREPRSPFIVPRYVRARANINLVARGKLHALR